MKYYYFYLLFFFFLLGCHPTSVKKGIPCIDLDCSYPKKELSVQMLSKVRYILFETDSTCLLRDNLPLCISKEYIIFYNKNTGSLLLFDHNGKKVRSIRKKGMGPEEYMGIRAVAYDERTHEMYCVVSFDKEVKVYTEEGAFQRALPLKAGTFLEYLFDYNDSLLLCWNNNIEGSSEYYFMHKKDTMAFETIYTIPFEKKIDRDIVVRSHLSAISIETPVTPLVFQGKDYLVAEPSSDTVYRLKDRTILEPVFCRTPSASHMSPEVLLDYGLENKDFLFITAVERQYDFQAMEGLHKKFYVLEKSTGEIYSTLIFNSDYPDDPDFHFSTYGIVSGRWVNYYSSEKLREALDNHQLSGELKEIASKLHEEDNGVLMMIDFI